MTWAKQSGNRIPAGVRRAVRQRDSDRCQLALPGCTGWYEDIDHINNLARLGISRSDQRGNYMANLQCVCKPCHNQKTQAEAMHGRTWWKRQPERPPWQIKRVDR